MLEVIVLRPPFSQLPALAIDPKGVSFVCLIPFGSFVFLAGFGVRVLIAQPGGMRTSLFELGRVARNLTPLPEPHKGTMADRVLQSVSSTHGSQRLDPDGAA